MVKGGSIIILKRESRAVVSQLRSYQEPDQISFTIYVNIMVHRLESELGVASMTLEIIP